MGCPTEECAADPPSESANAGPPVAGCPSTGEAQPVGGVPSASPVAGKEPSTGLFQIGLLGRENVGKSALVHRFIRGEALKEYKPTEYEIFTHEVEVDGKKIIIQIGDAGGSPANSEAIDNNIAESNGFILVYDITQQESFDEIQKIRAHLLQVKQPQVDIPIVLVGNKSDLNPQRNILSKQGTTLGQSMRCPFFETSIITGENVSEAFMAAISAIQNKKPAGKKEGKKGCCALL